MKRILSISALMVLVAGTSLLAQTDKLVVKGGKTFTYTTSSETNSTQSIGGQEMSVSSTSEGTSVLKVTNIVKDKIDWTFAIPRIHTTMNNPMMGGEMDTTMSVAPIPFSTNQQGTLIGEVNIAEALESIGGGMSGQKLTAESYFSPTLARTLTPGATWDKTTVDTTVNNGIEIHISQTIHYTFDGPVDTLKTHTVRLRAEATSMTIDGAGSMQAFNLVVNGDGTMHSVSYYSTKDGMLTASTTETEIDARAVITGAQEMIIPTTSKTVSSMRRK